jgi:hypothetical protein
MGSPHSLKEFVTIWGVKCIFKGHLFIYLALAKLALPGQFDLLVSSQSKEKS